MCAALLLLGAVPFVRADTDSVPPADVPVAGVQAVAIENPAQASPGAVDRLAAGDSANATANATADATGDATGDETADEFAARGQRFHVARRLGRTRAVDQPRGAVVGPADAVAADGGEPGPAMLMMTTCFVRIAIVLGLLRQALGAQQLPSNQVVSSLALFMTFLIMTPVWTQVYHDAVEPYTAHEMTLEEAWQAGVRPVRGFMAAQIERTGNSSDVWLFYKYLPEGTPSPSSYDDVPLSVLLPAFMLSELKTAFLIGFQIFLPFLVIDLVVSSVTISMGMFMLPPVLVSLPLKLLLFVLIDGWHLVVGMLMDSFQLVG